MKTKETNSEQEVKEPKEIWTKPELKAMSIVEHTLGKGDVGFDFASEMS